ncbi:MAG: hypothetical protein JSS66_06965 [Armatimonadetes bacterium]|nr:hypothetical protein [Armatimonadota bacterium]
MGTLTRPLSLLDTATDERRPLTREETELMTKSLLAGMTAASQVPFDSKECQGTIVFGAFMARLDYADVQVTPAALGVVLSWTDGRPGDLVLWSYTVFCLAKNLGKRLIVPEDLVDAFPEGIPTEPARKRIWLAQKSDQNGHSVNLLDLDEVWK